jgi:hypothetical protein
MRSSDTLGTQEADHCVHAQNEIGLNRSRGALGKVFGNIRCLGYKEGVIGLGDGNLRKHEHKSKPYAINALYHLWFRRSRKYNLTCPMRQMFGCST